MPAADARADGDDDAVITGIKRARSTLGKTDGQPLAPEAMKNVMGNLPATLGEGEHERPMMEVILVALRDLSMDVQDLKGALYVSWELDKDSPYVLEGVKMKDAYQQECRKVKGTGVSLGHMKNYCMIGLFTAAKKDETLSPDAKATLENKMGKLLRNREGRLTTEKALEIAPMVAYCQVVRTKKKGFVNLLMRAGDGMAVMEILSVALDAAGKRQADASVPKPIFREIKEALATAKGGGKGAGGSRASSGR